MGKREKFLIFFCLQDLSSKFYPYMEQEVKKQTTTKNKNKTFHSFLPNFFKVKRMFANFHIWLEISKSFTTKQRNKQANMTFLLFQKNNTSNLQLTVNYLTFFIQPMKGKIFTLRKQKIILLAHTAKQAGKMLWSKVWNVTNSSYRG